MEDNVDNKRYLHEMDVTKTKKLFDFILEKEKISDLKYVILQLPSVLHSLIFNKDMKVRKDNFRFLNAMPGFYYRDFSNKESLIGIYNDMLGLAASFQFLPPLRLPLKEKISQEQLFSIVIHHELRHHQQFNTSKADSLEDYLMKKELELKKRNPRPYIFKHSKFLIEIDAYIYGIEKTLKLFQEEPEYQISNQEKASLEKVLLDYKNKKNIYFDDDVFENYEMHLLENVNIKILEKLRADIEPIDNTILGLEYHCNGTKKSIYDLLQSALNDENTNPEIYHYLIGKQANFITDVNLQELNDQEKQYLGDSFNWYTNYFLEKRKTNHQLLQEKGITQKQWVRNEAILVQHLANSMQGSSCVEKEAMAKINEEEMRRKTV